MGATSSRIEFYFQIVETLSAAMRPMCMAAIVRPCNRGCGHMYKRTMLKGEPAVKQAPVHGHDVSYNPDDGRYYVHHADGQTRTTFNGWANTVQFCRLNKPG